MGLQTMPSIAWFPLAILLFKLTEEAITFVVVLGAAPSIANGLIHGVDHIPPVLTPRRAGAGREGHRRLPLRDPARGDAQLRRPASSRAGRSPGGSLMAGELLVVIANKTSLGQLLQVNRDLVDSEGLLSIMLVILTIGILLDSLVFGTVERRIRAKRGPAHAVGASRRQARPGGQCPTSASGSSSSARTSAGSSPATTSAIVTRSSTRRTLTRFASQTSRSAVAGPSNRERLRARSPRTSASGPSTARMTSAIVTSLAGRPSR